MILAWRGFFVTNRVALELLGYAEPIVCLCALLIMWRRQQFSQFRSVGLFLASRVASFALLKPILEMGGKQIPYRIAYPLYFYGYWFSYALDAVLGFFVIYSIYNLSMAPLKGLQRLGRLMFRWAAGIAVAIAVTMAMGPHVNSYSFIKRAVTQFQETQSILTLCMLLFVCLAIRPMGLTYRSKIFGVSLGLGVLATTDLVGAAWLSHFSSMYSVYSVLNGVAICTTVLVWSAYFAVPEPKRRMIILPTTSPFLRWNQISMALGDEPGYVALGEITPEMFAPAEVEVMRRASMKMRHSIAN